MKKARTTSVRKKAAAAPQPTEKLVAVEHRAPVALAAPAAAALPVAVETAPKKTARGLGSLGRKSLDRAEMVASLVLIPANKNLPESSVTKKSAHSFPGSATVNLPEQNESALVRTLRDELHALLALLDDVPPGP